MKRLALFLVLLFAPSIIASEPSPDGCTKWSLQRVPVGASYAAVVAAFPPATTGSGQLSIRGRSTTTYLSTKMQDGRLFAYGVTVLRGEKDWTLYSLTASASLRPGERSAVLDQLRAAWGPPTLPRSNNTPMAERLAARMQVGFFTPSGKALSYLSEAMYSTPDVFTTVWLDEACGVRAAFTEILDRAEKYEGRLPVVVSLESVLAPPLPAPTDEESAVVRSFLSYAGERNP